MNKDEFKKANRANRIAKSPVGQQIGKFMTGEIKTLSTFDNSHIWGFQGMIAAEIAENARKQNEQ